MKTTITIENGRIEIQVDDQAPVLVQPAIPITPITSTAQNTNNEKPSFAEPNANKKTEVAESPKPPQMQMEHDKTTPQMDPDCGYCRRRGSACARHGGTPSPSFKGSQTKPRPFSLNAQPTEPIRPSKPAATKLDPAFTDPWDCAMCRNAQDLCVMHEQMANEGKRPPGVFTP